MYVLLFFLFTPAYGLERYLCLQLLSDDLQDKMVLLKGLVALSFVALAIGHVIRKLFIFVSNYKPFNYRRRIDDAYL